MPHKKGLPHFHPLPRLGNPARLALPALVRLAAGLVLAGTGASLPAAETWDSVAPALLAEHAPRIDPDAPAEAVFRRMMVDDRDFPDHRIIQEYSRYKIYDPEKATAITRISQVDTTVDGMRISGDFAIRARLTLPDGTARDFGKESLRQRSLLRTGPGESWLQRMVATDSAELNESFLAISGIDPGAVLDIQISRRLYGTAAYGFARLNIDLPIEQVLQLPYPTRQLQYTQRLADQGEYAVRPFLLNGVPNHAEIKVLDHQRTVQIAAHDVPGLVQEPFSGPPPDFALTYLSSYMPRHANYITHNLRDDRILIDRKSGPWAPTATRIYIAEKDMTQPNYRVEKLAPVITAGAASETDKAGRIHRYVHDLYLRFLRVPRARHLVNTPFNEITSLDQVLDCENHPDDRIPQQDFVWLALALFRQSGLEAQAVMLPNRMIADFDPRMMADMFLPNLAIRVRTGGVWQYSCQTVPAPIAFGMIPWQWTGQGLVVQPNKQEFVPAELGPAGQSVVTNTGKFQLAADGNLTGVCRRIFTGQAALGLRIRLRTSDIARQRSIFRRLLAAEFRSATVHVMQVTGADDADVPLTVSYRIEYPGFATTTKERIIFRPSIFHASDAAFSSSLRHYAVRFPFSWQDVDRIEIQYPAGYRVETKWAPPSYPGSDVSYTCGMSYLPHHDIFHLVRNFSCSLPGVPVVDYSRFKAWSDQVAASDQHDLVLVKTAEPAKSPGS